jgi:hypothetical protein
VNILIRVFVGIVTVCFLVAEGNFYLNFGWFGAQAKLVSSMMMLVMIFALILGLRFWREPRR